MGCSDSCHSNSGRSWCMGSIDSSDTNIDTRDIGQYTNV